MKVELPTNQNETIEIFLFQIQTSCETAASQLEDEIKIPQSKNLSDYKRKLFAASDWYLRDKNR